MKIYIILRIASIGCFAISLSLSLFLHLKKKAREKLDKMNRTERMRIGLLKE